VGSFSEQVRGVSDEHRHRVAQRLLALATGVWFNWQLDAPVKRSLVAYDH
jgi:hypothetical protein